MSSTCLVRACNSGGHIRDVRAAVPCPGPQHDPEQGGAAPQSGAGLPHRAPRAPETGAPPQIFRHDARPRRTPAARRTAPLSRRDGGARPEEIPASAVLRDVSAVVTHRRQARYRSDPRAAARSGRGGSPDPRRRRNSRPSEPSARSQRGNQRPGWRRRSARTSRNGRWCGGGDHRGATHPLRAGSLSARISSSADTHSQIHMRRRIYQRTTGR